MSRLIRQECHAVLATALRPSAELTKLSSPAVMTRLCSRRMKRVTRSPSREEVRIARKGRPTPMRGRGQSLNVKIREVSPSKAILLLNANDSRHCKHLMNFKKRPSDERPWISIHVEKPTHLRIWFSDRSLLLRITSRKGHCQLKL